MVSWYPPGTQDSVQKGKELAVEDGVLMPLLLRCAAVEGLKIGAPSKNREEEEDAPAVEDVDTANKDWLGESLRKLAHPLKHRDGTVCTHSSFPAHA